jgi:hypothetical protein
MGMSPKRSRKGLRALATIIMHHDQRLNACLGALAPFQPGLRTARWTGRDGHQKRASHHAEWSQNQFKRRRR